MRTIIFKNKWLSSLAILLLLPTTYLILIGIFSEFGINGPLKATQPLAEKWGIKDPPGLNITSVIAFGPMIAFLLTVFQFMQVELKLGKEEIFLHFSFYKRWFPIVIALACVGVLAVLSLFMFGENCNCH